MRRRFKKALSLLSAAAMCFSMALSLPEGTIGWGILANAEDEVEHEHNYVNGFCTDCDAYEQPKLDNAFYQISNAGELYWFAELVNGTLDGGVQDRSANAVLTADITLNENVLTADGELASDTSGFKEWTPIGKSGNSYKGKFDGQWYTISGMYRNSPMQYAGLFGYVDDSASVFNVTVKDSYIQSNLKYAGGVIAYNRGTVEGCSFAGKIVSQGDIAGLCGTNTGTIKNCYNNSSVFGSIGVGGIVGRNYGTIENCFSNGSVSGSDQYGGIVGCNTAAYSYPATIKNSYFNSTIYNGSAVGINKGTVGDDVLGKTSDQFASGEVAYLLYNETDGYDWGQKLGEDNHPVLGGERVYIVNKYITCDKSDTPVEIYSNSEDDIVVAHDYVDGYCKNCGNYQPAVLTTDKYDVDGDGTNDSAYEISNAGQLYWFAGLVNGTLNDINQSSYANAVLTDDIVVNNGVLDNAGNLVSETDKLKVWTPIGDSDYENGRYNNYFGTFNGMKHTIRGLYCVGDFERSGLFGCVLEAKVFDIGIIDSYFKGTDDVGAICGSANSTTISNCFSNSTVVGSKNVGGICGSAIDDEDKVSISNCYNTGFISGGTVVGGICGKTSTSIYTSYNTGKISGEKYVGGIFGNSDSDSRIVKNCYNSGDITATESDVGGIAGRSRSSIEVCYNIGSVSGKKFVGGIAGNADKINRNEIVVNNCYNVGDVQAIEDRVGGITGANYAVVKSCYNIGNVVGGTKDSDWLINISFISGYEISSIDNCYYLMDCADQGERFYDLNGDCKTSSEFASGEVAYYLNVDGDNADVWKQTLGEQDNPNFTGKTVYATKEYSGCENAPGDKFTLSFNNDGEQTIYADHTDADNDGLCDYCQKLMEKLAGATVSLDSAIGLNFFMDIADAVGTSDETYMRFTLENGETRDVKGAAVDNDGKKYYVFTCELAAKEMSDIVTAQLFFGEKAGEKYTYSVKEYAESIIANKTGDYSAESIALAKAMLNYGANSQTYFEYNTVDLANSSLSENDKALSTTTDSIADHKFTISSNKNVCTFVSAYLSLESKTKVNVYVDLADGVNVDDVTFRVGGNEVKPTMKNGHYLLTVDGIEFPDLGEKFKFEVAYNGETATLEYGALSFCYTVLGSSKHSKNIKDVSAALGDVYSAAVKYVEKKMAS